MSKERPQAFDLYRAMLRRGVDSDVAWSDAFPDVSLKRIDATVHAYLQSPDRRLWWVQPVDVHPVPPTIRPLGREELTQLGAELARGASESVATGR